MKQVFIQIANLFSVFGFPIPNFQSNFRLQTDNPSVPAALTAELVCIYCILEDRGHRQFNPITNIIGMRVTALDHYRSIVL